MDSGSDMSSISPGAQSTTCVRVVSHLEVLQSGAQFGFKGTVGLQSAFE